MPVRVTRTVNRTDPKTGTTWHRWRIGDLPPELIEQMGWQHGDELEVTRKGNTLTLRKKEG